MMHKALASAAIAVAIIILGQTVDALAQTDDPAADNILRADLKRDYKKEVELLAPLITQVVNGDAKAEHSLGLLYITGLDYLRRDESVAAKLFGLAAAQGNVDAQVRLGMMKDIGEPLPKNEREAVRLFRLAALQRDATAAEALASHYFSGGGVTKDLVRAYMWQSIGLQFDYSLNRASALELLARFSEDMSPAQIASAVELSRKCLASNLKDCE